MPTTVATAITRSRRRPVASPESPRAAPRIGTWRDPRPRPLGASDGTVGDGVDIGADGTPSAPEPQTRSGLAAAQARRSARDRVLTTFAAVDPGPARLADRPSARSRARRCRGRPSRSRGRSRAATARRARSTARSRRWRRAVHLEGRPGPGGLGVDRVPVEVEVVARLDLPAGRVGDDVDVRAADRVERPPRQLGPRLAARRRGPTRRRRRSARAGRPRSRASPSARTSSSQPWSSRKPSAGVSGGAVPAASSAANRALSAAMISALLARPGRASGRGRSRATGVWSVRTW